jgi:hypothetical protein
MVKDKASAKTRTETIRTTGMMKILPAINAEKRDNVTWRQGSTRHKRATEGSDNEMVGGLKLLHTSQTLMQSI